MKSPSHRTKRSTHWKCSQKKVSILFRESRIFRTRRKCNRGRRHAVSHALQILEAESSDFSVISLSDWIMDEARTAAASLRKNPKLFLRSHLLVELSWTTQRLFLRYWSSLFLCIPMYRWTSMYVHLPGFNLILCFPPMQIFCLVDTHTLS